MRVAYIFSMTGHTDTNALQAEIELGERLADVAAEQDIMLCDQCADERGLAVRTDDRYEPIGTVPGVHSCSERQNACSFPSKPKTVVGCTASLFKVISGADEQYRA